MNVLISNSMMRALALPPFLGALLLLAAGCASPPAVQFHDIRLAMPEAYTESDLGALQLERVTVPTHLDRAEIFYRTTEYDAGYYEYHHWVRPLSESLPSELMAYLRATGRFGSLAGPDERLPAALRMRIKVLEFAENDAGGEVWHADVALLVRMHDPSTGLSLEETLKRSVPLKVRNASGAVEALNRALSAAAGDILESIESFARQ
jgi:uncharacterized lipoprotein YmbA